MHAHPHTLTYTHTHPNTRTHTHFTAPLTCSSPSTFAFLPGEKPNKFATITICSEIAFIVVALIIYAVDSCLPLALFLHPLPRPLPVVCPAK